METSSRDRLCVSVSSAVFITDKNGNLLLLKQASEKKGFRWGPPAGGMEAHETPIGTAKRETREEIGVTIQIKDLIGVYTVDRADGKTSIGFVFRGVIVSGEITPAEGEITEYKFFSPDEIRTLIESDELYKPEFNKVAIRDWLREQAAPANIVSPEHLSYRT